MVVPLEAPDRAGGRGSEIDAGNGALILDVPEQRGAVEGTGGEQMGVGVGN